MYRKLPTVSTLTEFLGAVNEKSKHLSFRKHEHLTTSIEEIKRRLSVLEGDAETKAIEELSRLNYERRSVKGELTVEALQTVALDSRFQGYDWASLVSHDPREYGLD